MFPKILSKQSDLTCDSMMTFRLRHLNSRSNSTYRNSKYQEKNLQKESEIYWSMKKDEASFCKPSVPKVIQRCKSIPRYNRVNELFQKVNDIEVTITEDSDLPQQRKLEKIHNSLKDLFPKTRKMRIVKNKEPLPSFKEIKYMVWKLKSEARKVNMNLQMLGI